MNQPSIKSLSPLSHGQYLELVNADWYQFHGFDKIYGPQQKIMQSPEPKVPANDKLSPEEKEWEKSGRPLSELTERKKNIKIALALAICSIIYCKFQFS